MERELGIPYSVLDYHLGILVERGRIRQVRSGRYTRFYPEYRSREIHMEGESDPRVMRLLSILREEIPYSILLHLLKERRSTFGEIATAVEVGRSHLAYHLRPLRELGVVRKAAGSRMAPFFLTDADEILEILTNYEPLPSQQDRYAEMWRILYRRS